MTARSRLPLALLVAAVSGCAGSSRLDQTPLAPSSAGNHTQHIDATTLGVDIDEGTPPDCTEDPRPIGVGAADLDGDGDVDLVVPTLEGPIALYLNDGRGQFTSGGELPVDHLVMGVGLVDIDGDRAVDVVAAGTAVTVFAGDGGGSFDGGTRIFEPRDGGVIGHVSAGDLDGDGVLDLSLAGYIEAQDSLCWPDGPPSEHGANSWALLQLGDGEWEVGQLGRGYSHLAPIRDLDWDGVPELWELNEDRGFGGEWPASYIWDWRGRERRELELNASPMGVVSLGDADGNGCPEVLVTDVARVLVWELCEGEPLDVSLRTSAELQDAHGAAEAGDRVVGWSVVPLGGGRAFVANAEFGHPDEEGMQVAQPDFVVGWEGGEELQLVESLPARHPWETGRSATAADLDGDGLAEVVVRHLGGTLSIWRFAARRDCAPAVVVLQDETSPANARAVGARLTTSGESRFVAADAASYGASPTEVYLCVGEDEPLTIHWPDGEVTDHVIAPGVRATVTRP